MQPGDLVSVMYKGQWTTGVVTKIEGDKVTVILSNGYRVTVSKSEVRQ